MGYSAADNTGLSLFV